MSTLPLGRDEDERLELRSAATLARPESIARVVAAMLNADGGEVWIGIDSEDGTATRIVPLEGARRQRDLLEQRLAALIEPSPNLEEVVVELVPHGAGELVRVRVARGSRGPYAQLSGTARVYVTRSGASTRPLTRDELQELFGRPPARESATDAALRALERERTRRLEARWSGLWVALRLAQPQAALCVTSARLADLLEQPRLSGNRSGGWACVGGPWEARRAQDELCLGSEGARRTVIRADTTIRFEVELRALRHVGGAAREIWPLAWIEFIVSVFRLGRAAYEGAALSTSRVAAAAALFGLRGWSLRPYSPNSIGWPHIGNLEGPVAAFEEQDLLLEPVVVPWSALSENADACAWPVVESVYRAFGYEARAIPREFDPQTRRLTLGT